MLTAGQIKLVLNKWETAGLVPPMSIAKDTDRLVQSFLERFYWMDSGALQYVGRRLMSSNTWPNFRLIEETAREYQEHNGQYTYIDYYKELKKKAYKEAEDFDSFIQRIAETYFPGKAKEWCLKHAFTLHFYGVRIAACRDCQGICPYNGHQYHLRIKKGTDTPVPWANLELCPKYTHSIDRNGVTRPKERTKEDWGVPDDQAEPNTDMAQLITNSYKFDDFSTKKSAKGKLKEQDLFDTTAMEDVNNAGTSA